MPQLPRPCQRFSNGFEPIHLIKSEQLPPMDTDGQREDNGRGVREYRRDNPGSNLGRREVGGRSAGAFGGADGGLQWLWRARWRDRTRQEALADWASASLRGRWAGGSVADGRRQAGSGMARSRARARLNCSSQGQRLGRCRVIRRAERVSRPARAKTRRRRVLVVTICSPRPMRAVQRARCGPSPVPPARRRWRRSGPRGDGSARRRT